MLLRNDCQRFETWHLLRTYAPISSGHSQIITPRNYCLSKISLTACRACLSEREAFLQGVDVNWRELPWQCRERLPTCQPFLEDSFSCQPPHLKRRKKKKNVGSSVSHSWSGKRWQIPLCASRQVWWTPGEIAFRHQVTASLKIRRLIHMVAWKWSEVIKFCSRWSLIGWTPSVLLFAEVQLIPWLNTLISCVVEIRHKADLFLAHGSFFFSLLVDAKITETIVLS